MFGTTPTIKTNNRSSRIEASWRPRVISSKAGGEQEVGSWDARGATEMRDASGAVVGGIRVASGFHGAELVVNVYRKLFINHLRSCIGTKDIQLRTRRINTVGSCPGSSRK